MVMPVSYKLAKADGGTMSGMRPSGRLSTARADQISVSLSRGQASPLAGALEAGVGAAAAAAGVAEEDEMHGGDAEAEGCGPADPGSLAGKLRDAMMEAVAAPLTPRIE